MTDDEDRQENLIIVYMMGATHGRDDERAKIAEWFLKHNKRELADKIKAKEYMK